MVTLSKASSLLKRALTEAGSGSSWSIISSSAWRLALRSSRKVTVL
jgi:hypothetical protein